MYEIKERYLSSQVTTTQGAAYLDYNQNPPSFVVDPPVLDSVSRLISTSYYEKRKASIGNIAVIRKKSEYLPPLPYFVHQQIIPNPSYGVGVVTGVRSYRNGDKGGSFTSSKDSGAVPFVGRPPEDSLTREQLDRCTRISKTKLLNEAKDSKFNGAVAFAEAKQLESLIGDSAKKLASSLVSLSRGRLLEAARPFGLRPSRQQARRYSSRHRRAKTPEDMDQVLSSGVLTLQYGIRPLLNDIVGAAELFAQKTSAFHYSSVVASHRETDERTTTTIDDLPFSQCKRSLTRKSLVIVKYGVMFGKEDETTHTVAQLGLTNPALLLWEKMPWSFVIDWFLPVGNYLSSLDATLGFKFLSGYKSTLIRTSGQHSMVLNPSNSKDFDFGNAVATDSQETFERVILTDWPSPSLPPFKNPVSWEHALNGIALLAQFKKKPYW